MDLFTRTLGALAIVVSVATGVVASDDAQRLTEYELTRFDGATHSLSEDAGEVVVVNFWASWCAPCLKELPVFDAWNSDWSTRGARVVAISVDHDARKARRFVEKTGLGLDFYHDGPDGLARELDLPFLPCTFVLDQAGEIVLVSGGSSEQELERVRRTVEELLGTSAANAAPGTGGAR